jgi:hypothetical protein
VDIRTGSYLSCKLRFSVTESASAEGLLLVVTLSLLHSPLWSEGRYSAAVGNVFSGGAALTELRARVWYKRFCLESAGASHERVSLCVSQA